MKTQKNKTNKALESNLNWGKYSDNYITGKAPNGHIILASRSAVDLSLMVSREKNNRKALVG